MGHYHPSNNSRHIFDWSFVLSLLVVLTMNINHHTIFVISFTPTTPSTSSSFSSSITLSGYHTTKKKRWYHLNQCCSENNENDYNNVRTINHCEDNVVKTTTDYKSNDIISIYETKPSRRSFLINSIILTPITTTKVLAYDENDDANNNPLTKKQPQQRIKGAAEYDFEFYMRNLIQGNNPKEGNIQPSPLLPSPKPKTLKYDLFSSPFLELFVNDRDFSTTGTTDNITSSIFIQELSKITATPTSNIVSKIIKKRDVVSKAFYTKSPWEVASTVDEYYFDLTSYALFKVASDLIPTDYALRSTWLKNVGNRIYSQHVRNTLLPPAAENNNIKSLSQTASLIVQILDLYKATNFVSQYKIGTNNNSSNNKSSPSLLFDEYDDEDYESGNTINFLITLYRPATLGSMLQINGEGSRFVPEFVGLLVQAMLEYELSLPSSSSSEKKNNVNVLYEYYFVDGTYRPNPKDFFPDEVLLQFSITKS